ncbi:hypothetical protein [Deinococcus hohokamensis]|uniref:Uncharacterized protein n=1 Tax=Deinococcus hohokamensis TaxID=309883 RepID=A0ABV9I6Z3_9DEIO
MTRVLTLMLTALALSSGLADAQRRSGGGFGGSRSRSYSVPRTPTYRAPTYRAPAPTPRNSTVSPYTAPRTTPGTTRTPSSAQRSGTQASLRSNPLNTAAAARVTPTQLSQWNKVRLPAGVPRDAITYSAAAGGRYQYQLQPGRYYPYPQSYYRQRNIGLDILKYALIFTAVSSVADALTPDVVVAPGTAPVVVQNQGPNLWTYVGVGFLAAAAAWFMVGRRR